MLAVKSMDVRDNFKSLCDKVFNGETLIISRPKNENIVMLSEAEYNEMMKAKRNAEYLAMLDKSMAEAEAGGFVTKSIEELEAQLSNSLYHFFLIHCIFSFTHTHRSD